MNRIWTAALNNKLDVCDIQYEHFSLPYGKEGPFHVCFSWNERFESQRLL